MIELVIAMVFIAVAVSALISVFAAGQLSLRNAGREGTALTLAETQLEAYRTMPYAELRIDPATLPAEADPYVTASSLDASIPGSGGQVLEDVPGIGTAECAAAIRLLQGCATQLLTGPDGRSYRLDTYIHESGGLRHVTVISRRVADGVATIEARATTSFDPANPPA